MTLTRRRCIAALGSGLLIPIASAQSQKFPYKPVKIIVPAAPGGSADKNIRAISDKLSQLWKQSVVVEYKAGANTIIGTDFVAKSAPDGHTLLINSAAIVVNPSMYTKLPYDTVRDLIPVSMVSTAPFALVVHPSVPANNAKEFLELARTKPETLSFGTAESRALLAGLQFNLAAKTRLESVPFKGAGALMNDLVAGHIPVAFSALSSVQTMVNAGRVRLIGIATAKSSPLAPNATPLAADIVPGFEAESWFGLFAPHGTPKAIIDQISHDVANVLREPDVVRRFTDIGAQPFSEASDPFARRVKSEIESTARIARAANLKPE